MVYDQRQSTGSFEFRKGDVQVCYTPEAVPAVGTSVLRVSETECSRDPVPSPADLTATPGDGRVSISWSAAAAVDSYQVQVRDPQDQVVGSCQTSDLSCEVTGLTNGTVYTVALAAVRTTAGSDEQSSQMSTTVTPTAVAVPEAVAVSRGGYQGSGQYLLTWNPPATPVDGSRIYAVSPYAYSTTVFTTVDPDSASWTLIGTADADDTSTTVPVSYTTVGGTSGAWRMYRVVAFNAAGSSPSSNQVVVADGARTGQGSWLVCAVQATGKVRIAAHIPDTWGLTGPFTYQVETPTNVVLAHGTQAHSGVFPVDVPDGSTLKRIKFTDSEGVTRSIGGGGTVQAGYQSLFNAGQICPN